MFQKSSFLVSVLVAVLSAATTPTLAFLPPTGSARVSSSPSLRMSTNSEESFGSQVETFLAEYFPSYYNILLKPSEEVVKKLRENANNGFTVFAPNEAAFEALGEKKIRQLMDDRNTETTLKMAAYHTVGDEMVSLETLSSDNVGGILTMGGEVVVGASQTGGFFGIGAKDDGGVVVGSGRIVQSYPVGPGVVHEVDGVVSPAILWRYMDQLRIPGSG